MGRGLMMLVGLLTAAASHAGAQDYDYRDRIQEILGDSFASVQVTGRVRVIDGDTFALGNVRVRLFGIDAPELDEVCEGDEPGLRPTCGQLAAIILATVIKHGPVCDVVNIDRYGRVVATCDLLESPATISLSRVMVEQGYARMVPDYSGDLYAGTEAIARETGHGFWACDVGAPAAWAELKAKDC